MKPSLLQKHTRIKIYKTLTRPVLACGCEAWTIRKNDETRITAAEMRFMRRKANCTKWGHKRNEEIMEELKTESVLGYRDRTGEIMSTEWIEEGTPNKFCSTRLGAEDVKASGKKMARDRNRRHGLTHVWKKKKKNTCYSAIWYSTYSCWSRSTGTG
jgi:hypothetical protein